MAFTITLHAGHVFTPAEAITIDKLNKLFSLGYATVDSGTVDTANVANKAITVDKMADLARGSIYTGQGATNRPAALDAKTSGQILVGDGTDLKSVAVSGMIALSSAGAVTIPLTRGSILTGQGTGNLAAALDAKTAGKMLVGNGTDINSVAVTGDVTLTAAGLIELNASHANQREIVQIEHLGAGINIATPRPIFVVPDCTCALASVGILTQGTPAGFSASDNAVIEIKDETANLIVSKTYNAATQPPTNNYESFGMLDPTYRTLAAAEHITITVTQSAAADLPAFQLVLVYTPNNA